MGDSNHSSDIQNASYPMGSLIFFTLVFVLTLLFFLLVLWVNKGPIDQSEWDVATSFTLEEKRQRNQSWRTATPEAIEQGRKLFDIQVFGQLEPIFDLILQGEYGSTEVQLYRVLTYGLPGTAFRSWEYLPQVVRWQMVHYIRSRMSEPQTASAKDWQVLDEEGI